jgi:hypothetical protein
MTQQNDPYDAQLDELRKIRDAALAADTGDPVVDAYERAAIMQSWKALERDIR